MDENLGNITGRARLFVLYGAICAIIGRDGGNEEAKLIRTLLEIMLSEKDR